LRDLTKIYKVGKEIGHGRYGIVRLACKRSFERKRLAIKSIPKEHLKGDFAKLIVEFDILKSIYHPNIISFEEVCIDDFYFHIITEYCGGGELFDHLSDKGSFDEANAAKLTKQILQAIKHLHELNICHRDLKPENVLFESKGKDPMLKLIDFGLSKVFVPGEPRKMKTKIGTSYYMAPEVIEGDYTDVCDLWSVGIITYCLLCGYPPFQADNDLLLFKKI